MLKLKQRIIKTQRGDTKRWYIKGTCPYTRRPVRESTGVDSRAEAEHILAAYLSRAREEAALGTCNGVAFFAEAVAEYAGKKGEARFLSPLLEHFGKTRLRDIEDQDPSGAPASTPDACQTKTLVVSAHAARLAARAAEFGVVIDGRIAIDVGRVKARKDAVSNPYLTNDARTRRRASWVGLAGAAAED